MDAELSTGSVSERDDEQTPPASERAVAERSDDDSASPSVTPEVSDGDADYPYLVRRTNVSDERDIRLELFVRDEVISEESEFRRRLSDAIGINEVSKTDAREYALLYAYRNVEGVADRMQDDGADFLA